MNIFPADDTVDIIILGNLLNNYLATSYKLFWFSGILKEIISGNQVITFKKLNYRMIAEAWYPILKYHLDFGPQDQLNKIVMDINNKYSIGFESNENVVLKKLEKLEESELLKEINNFSKYVPFRLISTFFTEETIGLPDGKKNKLLLFLSQNSSKAFYQINMTDKTIRINDNWFNYFYKNQIIVTGWLNYKIICYLQKKNPNVPAIPFKLSAQGNRNLDYVKKFWNEIKDQTDLHDIYTDLSFTQNNYNKYGVFSIDHFIPWSFVMHNEFWNLIPTFKNVNSSKNNKLPKLDLYMNKFCDVQYQAFNVIRKKQNKKLLEEYLTINKKLDLNKLLNTNRDISEKEFNNSLESTVKPLFQIAYNQGYLLWENQIV